MHERLPHPLHHLAVELLASTVLPNMRNNAFPWSIGGVADLKLKLKWLHSLCFLRVCNVESNHMGR